MAVSTCEGQEEKAARKGGGKEDTHRGYVIYPSRASVTDFFHSHLMCLWPWFASS